MQCTMFAHARSPHPPSLLPSRPHPPLFPMCHGVVDSWEVAAADWDRSWGFLRLPAIMEMITVSMPSHVRAAPCLFRISGGGLSTSGPLALGSLSPVRTDFKPVPGKGAGGRRTRHEPKTRLHPSWRVGTRDTTMLLDSGRSYLLPKGCAVDQNTATQRQLGAIAIVAKLHHQMGDGIPRR